MSRDHDSYRSRVKDIRSEARSLLERLRAERLAKSRYAPKPAATPVETAASTADIEAWTGGAPILSEIIAEPPAPAKPKATAKPAKAAATPKAKAKPAPAKPAAASKPAPAELPVAKLVPAPLSDLARPKPANAAQKKLASELNKPVESNEIYSTVATRLHMASEKRKRAAGSLPRGRSAKAATPVEPTIKAPVPIAMPEPVVVQPAAKPAAKRAKAPAVAAPAPDPIALAPVEVAPVEVAPPAPEKASRPRPASARPSRPAKVASGRPQRAPDLKVAPSVSVLPGIGPGMIWRLEQAGYRTLDDVAAARLEELSERLGAVGRLVKLDRWIAFAQERSGKAA